MKRLTTGEMAKRIGVSPITIRNWHKSGKLIPEYIDPDTKHRYYTEEQVYEYNKSLKKSSYRPILLYNMLKMVDNLIIIGVLE